MKELPQANTPHSAGFPRVQGPRSQQPVSIPQSSNRREQWFTQFLVNHPQAKQRPVQQTFR